MYSSHPAKGKFTRTQRHSLQFEVYRVYTGMYSSAQFAPSEGKIYSHTARNMQLTIIIWKYIYIPACTVRTQRRKIYSHTVRSTQLTIRKNILACIVCTERRKNLLAHSEEHTVHNLKNYTGMYSSHTVKEKFTRTQQGAHISQFKKNIPACTVRTQQMENLLSPDSERHTAYN